MDSVTQASALQAVTGIIIITGAPENHSFPPKMATATIHRIRQGGASDLKAWGEIIWGSPRLERHTAPVLSSPRGKS